MRASLSLLVGLLILFIAKPGQAEDQLEQVRLQLVWKHQFQFAGYYMAKEKGFYRDAGLDVELVEVENGILPIDEVMSGRAQFGVGRSSLLLDRLKGLDVVALMAAFQQSPLMLLTRADSGISSPGDLRGKRIMVTDDAVQVSEIIAMLLKFGISVDDVLIQQPTYSVQDLIDGRTDAVASYVSNEPFQMQQRGVDYHVIHPQDYGFPMYSDILFTSGQLADNRFDMVLRFRDASMRGWRYALDHIEESVDTILAHYNSQRRSREALLHEAKALRELAFDDLGRFGTLDAERFESMANVYRIASNVEPLAGLQGLMFCCAASAELALSPAQRHYLRSLDPVRLCSSTEWEPLQWMSDEQPMGLVVDYVEHIFAHLGLEHRFVASDSWSAARSMLGGKRCDLIAGIMPVVPSGDPLHYSRPFITIPIVAAVKEGADISQPRRLSQPIGVLRQHDLDRLLLRRYPELKVLRVDSVSDGLAMVLRGELSAFVDTRLSLEQAIASSALSGLRLDASLSDSFDLEFAAHSRQAPLIRLLDLALADLGQDERDRIRARWEPVTLKKGVDEAVVRNVLIAIAVLALLAGYRFYLVSATNRRLARMAREDGLTGISNRRHLAEQIDTAVELAERSGIPLTLIFFDIDDFKRVNDRFGHAAGDEVLRKVVDTVLDHIRRIDSFGRWGGEEFLVLLQDTDIEGGQRLAEKLRQAIADEVDIGGERISCSFGVAQLRSGEGAEPLISRADSALYQAKSRGKNRVEIDEKQAVVEKS
ncbi:ABC transporter substrate-binding protein [Marinobacterium sp. D7]|uniref:ABC transporter substrate-binding protein n=1 Tax=Marinobacterium ramblicola TaxID=2849041 RepID=UPI001C2D4E53|nr:ABC transporter substrate-binding protein [Marinobacterium ramblicola]MBV1787890.1 ABC transporter substrate-binding protein [Marinobacterium ramblicola]